MSITLSAPPSVIQDVRAYATRNGTSLNALIRAYLEQIAKQEQKARIAAELIAQSVLEDEICVSAQVLKEFANFAFKKTSKSAHDINEMNQRIAAYGYVPDSKELVEAAVVAKERYQIGFYDAQILAAAEEGGCSRIYSEDFGNGRKYGTITVINPFAGQRETSKGKGAK